MRIILDEIEYEVTADSGGLTFSCSAGERDVFTPWARVLDDAFPIEPGEHAERILEGTLSVRQYLAGGEGRPRPERLASA